MSPVAVKDLIQTDGHSDSGKIVSKRRLSEANVSSAAAQSLTEDHQVVLLTFRLLIADLCQQFNGGHPG